MCGFFKHEKKQWVTTLYNRNHDLRTDYLPAILTLSRVSL